MSFKDIESNSQDEIKKSYEDSKTSANVFKGILKSDFKFNHYKIEEGEHYWDIIPFESVNKTKEGNPKLSYKLDIYCHFSLGVDKNATICPTSYGQRCPICERYSALIRDGKLYNDPLVAAFKKKRRVFYNIMDIRSSDTRAEGIKVAEGSHYYLEARIVKAAKNPGQDAGFIPFNSSSAGSTLFFVREGLKLQTDYHSHRFISRKEQYNPDEIIPKAHRLDDKFCRPTYDEVKALLELQPPEEEALYSPEQEQEPDVPFDTGSAEKKETPLSDTGNSEAHKSVYGNGNDSDPVNNF